MLYRSLSAFYQRPEYKADPNEYKTNAHTSDIAACPGSK